MSFSDEKPRQNLPATLVARIPATLLWLRNNRLGDYIGALAVRGLEVFGKFGLYVFAARMLGGAESGILFFCITWVNLASAACRLGMERSLTRHIAAEIAVGRGDAARAALFGGLGWSLLGALLGAGLTVLFGQWAADHIFGQPELGFPLQISAALLIPQTLAVVLGFALAGVKRGALGQLVYSSLPPVLVLAVIFAGVHRLDAVILTFAGAFVLTSLLAAAFLLIDRHKFAEQPHLAVAEDRQAAMPSLWQSAVPFLMVELISVAMTSLPLLVLGAFAEPVALGAFSVASRLSSLVWMIIVSIGAIAAPRFAEHFRRGEADRLASVNRLVRRLTAAFCLPPVLVMLVAPAFLLGLVSPAFAIGAQALMIMSVGQLLNSVFAQQDTLLGMTGHGHTLRLISIGQLALGVVVGALTIPSLGSNGAAITTAACMVFGALISTVMARRLVPEAF